MKTKSVWPLLQDSNMEFLTKLKIALYDPVILQLAIYSKHSKAAYDRIQAFVCLSRSTHNSQVLELAA